jgi:hypothetical protein
VQAKLTLSQRVVKKWHLLDKAMTNYQFAIAASAL